MEVISTRNNDRLSDSYVLSDYELLEVHGGSAAISVAGSWASTVAGFATGAIIGGTRGAMVGGFAGFALGAAIGVGFHFANNNFSHH